MRWDTKVLSNSMQLLFYSVQSLLHCYQYIRCTTHPAVYTENKQFTVTKQQLVYTHALSIAIAIYPVYTQLDCAALYTRYSF